MTDITGSATGSRSNAENPPGDWAGLQKLSDHLIAGINLWLLNDYTSATSPTDESHRLLVNALLREAERRKWPDGWWEDPSVIPSLHHRIETVHGRTTEKGTK